VAELARAQAHRKIETRINLKAPASEGGRYMESQNPHPEKPRVRHPGEEKPKRAA
jgi:hypothetical protein